MRSQTQKVGESSHLGYAREKQVRGISIAECGDRLRNKVTSTSQTAGVVAVL